MRIKKGLYNIFFGFIGQIITITLGIIIPRLFILNLGSAANGLLSSVGQVLSYLTLLEAGLGGASIQALYKPLANKDIEGINRILSATSDYYKKTGKIYFLCVVGISLIYPLFINEFSYLVAFMVILLSGVPGVLNYYFQGKFRVLLMAEGKSYIISNISTVISVLTSISKIILIKFGCNIIHLQMVYCIISIFQVFIYEYLFKKSYKWVKYTAKPDYLAIKQKNSVLIHQISNLILTNTDVFILTIATNLKVVSVYTVYNMVFDMINTSVQTVGNSVSYIFGESFYTNRKKFKKIFDVYEVYFFNFTFSLYTITLLLIIPFLRLYTNGVSDINYIDFYLPILFTLMKLLACSRTPALNIINVVGLFKETQNSAIIEAIINLSVSIFAVYNWGIYGVIIGTIIALLYRAIYIVLFASKNILARSAFKTFIRWGINILIFCCIIFIEKKISRIEIFGYKDFFVYAIIYSVVVCTIFTLINSLINFKESKLIFSSIYLKIQSMKNKKRLKNI